jgi:hypothetical protein
MRLARLIAAAQFDGATSPGDLRRFRWRAGTADAALFCRSIMSVHYRSLTRSPARGKAATPMFCFEGAANRAPVISPLEKAA